MTSTRLLSTLSVLSLLLLAAFFASVPRAASAATGQLFVSQTCSSALPGRITVTLSWSGNDPSALQQWVDLSLFNNDWEAGTFLGAGPFAGSATSFTWDGLVPSATHYVRVNQQLAGGTWDPSPTFVVQTAPACTQATQESPPPPQVVATTPVAGSTLADVLSGGIINIASGGAIAVTVSTDGGLVITTPHGFQPFP